MRLRTQNKITHLFCLFIVYSHFEMPIFGWHTKPWSWESPEYIGSSLGPDTQEINHISIFKQKSLRTTTELG